MVKIVYATEDEVGTIEIIDEATQQVINIKETSRTEASYILVH